MNKKTRKLMILSGFIWCIANFHHPVTPSHFTSLNLPDHIFGTSYAAMVFSMFITAPIWGSIGDNGNRVKVLNIVTFFYGLFQIFLGRVESLAGVILARALAGTMTSGFQVGLMSALVDVNKAEDREKIMANYTALMGISGALGFLIGGYLGKFPSKYVFYIQGGAMLIVSLSIKLFIPETNPEDKVQDKKLTFIWDLLRDVERSEEVFTPWIRIFLAITFFVGIAYSGYNNAFNYYLKAELDMPPLVNGLWRAGNGIIGLLANLTINIWIIDRTNTKKTIVYLLAMSSISAFLVFFNRNLLMFFIFNFIFFILYLIELPILQAFAVDSKVKDVGLMSGLYSAAKSLGEMVGSSLAGFTYEINSKLPFLLGALTMAMAFLLSVFNYFSQVKREEKP